MINNSEIERIIKKIVNDSWDKQEPIEVYRIVKYESLNIVDNICGAYIIFFMPKNLMYIGSTDNFSRRLYEHKNYFKIKYCIPYSAYVFDTIDVVPAMFLEKELIKRLNPELNYMCKIPMTTHEIAVLKNNENNGHIRRKGLYDIIVSDIIGGAK